MPKFLSCAALLALSFFGSRAFTQASMSVLNNHPDKPVLGLPYSAYQSIRTVQHLASGITIARQVTGHLYRSSSGLERVEGTQAEGDEANPHPVTLAWIIDRSQSTVTLLHIQSKFATVTHLPANSRVRVTFLALPGDQKPPSFRSGKVENTDLGRRTQDGMVLSGNRAVRTVPFAGAGNDAPFVSTIEVWASPELQLALHEAENDPLDGERTLDVTNVRRDEPDPELFRIPEGFKTMDQPLGAGAGQAPKAH